MKFETFKSKSTGAIALYPAHYDTHPVFGDDLERYEPNEVEEDKTVVEDHNIPVDQRVRRTAKVEKETETGEKD